MWTLEGGGWGRERETDPFPTFQGEPCDTCLFFKEKHGGMNSDTEKKPHPTNNTQQKNSTQQRLACIFVSEQC